MSTVPPISEIANQAKRRKTSYGALQAAFAEAESLDLSALGSHIDRLSERQKEWLLVSKFGLTRVNEVCRLLSRIPDSVTISQRAHLLSCLPLNPEDLKSLSDFISDHCPHLIKGRCSNFSLICWGFCGSARLEWNMTYDINILRLRGVLMQRVLDPSCSCWDQGGHLYSTVSSAMSAIKIQPNCPGNQSSGVLHGPYPQLVSHASPSYPKREKGSGK